MKLIVKLIFNFLLLLWPTFVFCQNEVIVDPITFPCYRLTNNDTIRPLVLGGTYVGKVLVEARCDTANCCLMEFTILYAKLKSTINTTDSIEVRPDGKVGNYQFIEDNADAILKHCNYFKIERIAHIGCVIPKFVVPVPIE